KMAIRAIPTSRPSTFLTPRASSVPNHISKLQYKTISTSTTISTVTLLTTPKDANALSKDEIITTLTKVESAINQVQEVSTGVLDFSKNVIQGFNRLVLPILQKSGDQVVKIAEPVIEVASKKTQEAIEISGIDTEPIHKFVEIVGDIAHLTIKVIYEVKPIASSALEIIIRAEPIEILEASGGLLLSYLLFPPIWSLISFNFRGYKGKLTPAQTLDLLSRRNYHMIDIRLENDKNNAGIPLLPSSAKNKMISVPIEELSSKIKDLVRNVKKAEAGIVALKISYLRTFHRHSNIVIMDSHCDNSKIVASELTSLGFKNCWIVVWWVLWEGGWLQSQLGTEPNVSSLEFLLPSPAISPEVAELQSNEMFLPKNSE
ncbi:hypothetical protein IFM89_000473, partial [Coptis chinensis]